MHHLLPFNTNIIIKKASNWSSKLINMSCYYSHVQDGVTTMQFEGKKTFFNCLIDRNRILRIVWHEDRKKTNEEKTVSLISHNNNNKLEQRQQEEALLQQIIEYINSDEIWNKRNLSSPKGHRGKEMRKRGKELNNNQIHI